MKFKKFLKILFVFHKELVNQQVRHSNVTNIQIGQTEISLGFSNDVVKNNFQYKVKLEQILHKKQKQAMIKNNLAIISNGFQHNSCVQMSWQQHLLASLLLSSEHERKSTLLFYILNSKRNTFLTCPTSKLGITQTTMVRPSQVTI